ncbi:MAG: YbaB/EbfC family nucleoid-associated protein [Spirochaetales bacterium]|nr:YbaB/EbfC family nucleoid-associated protein [Spirochaetales bacterium]
MNPFDLLKNMQNIQEEVSKMQAKLAGVTAEGVSGGGMVKVVLNGHFEIVELVIEKDIIDKDASVILQDLIKAAFNVAMANIKEKIQQESMGSFNPSDLSSMFGAGQ